MVCACICHLEVLAEGVWGTNGVTLSGMGYRASQRRNIGVSKIVWLFFELLIEKQKRLYFKNIPNQKKNV